MDTIACMCLKDGDKILALHHKKHMLWSIPLGKVEAGETVEEALNREMREELGINIKKANKIADEVLTCYIPEATEVRTVVLEVLEYEGEIENLEPKKHSDIKFVDYDTLSEMESTEATKLLIRTLKEES